VCTLVNYRDSKIIPIPGVYLKATDATSFKPLAFTR
jgi:hypothetical protein